MYKAGILNPRCLHSQSPRVREEGGGCEKRSCNRTQNAEMCDFIFLIRPPDISREGFKFYPCTSFFSFIFLSLFVNTPCSAPRSGWPSNVSGGLVIGKA